MNFRYSSQQSVKKRGRFAVLVVFLISLTLSFIGSGDVEAASSSAYRLIGTVLSKSFTGAVLSDTTGIQSFYRLYEKLPDGSRIVQVRDDSISLKGPDSTLYDMYIAHDTKAVASVQNNVPANPYTPEVLQSTPGALRNAPTERIMNSYGKRRQRRDRSADEE